MHGRREQLGEPAGIECFSFDQVISATEEVSARGVDGPNHHLIPQHKALVEFVGTHLDLRIATGDTGEDEDAVFAQRLSGLKDQWTKARGLKDEVERTIHGTCFAQRRLTRTDVVDPYLAHEVAIA